MKWQQSRIGRFIDNKVVEFQYPNTVVFVSAWCDLSEMQTVLAAQAFNYVWIGQSPSPYMDHKAVALYFIPIISREEGDRVLSVFRATTKFSYARFYNGVTAIKALKNMSA